MNILVNNDFEKQIKIIKEIFYYILQIVKINKNLFNYLIMY